AGYRLTIVTQSFVVAPGAQASITVLLTASTAGIFSGRVAIGNNDSDENPFVINVTGAVVAPAPEIQVLDGSTDIPDNTGAVNSGVPPLGSGTVTRTFTVQNLGNANLTLGPGITVAAPFFLASAFGSTTLGPGASTTFTVGLTGILGTFSGQVSFATNDS